MNQRRITAPGVPGGHVIHYYKVYLPPALPGHRRPFVPMGKRRLSRPGFPIGTSPELQEVAILYEY